MKGGQRGSEAERHKVERQRGEAQRDRAIEKQKSRWAEEQRSRKAERQKSRGAERQRGRGAEEQRNRGAEGQRGRGAEEQIDRGINTRAVWRHAEEGRVHANMRWRGRLLTFKRSSSTDPPAYWGMAVMHW